jgi:hypothetical protein
MSIVIEIAPHRLAKPPIVNHPEYSICKVVLSSLDGCSYFVEPKPNMNSHRDRTRNGLCHDETVILVIFHEEHRVT